MEAEELSVRDVERTIQNHFSKGGRPGDQRNPPARSRTHPEPTSPDEAALIRGFEDALGAPVTIERRRSGGRVVIEFHSDEELDGLYQRVGGRPL